MDFKEVELPEEAVDAGLLDASFFSRRFLSIPFSRGEWVGLALGEVGSLTSISKASMILLTMDRSFPYTLLFPHDSSKVKEMLKV